MSGKKSSTLLSIVSVLFIIYGTLILLGVLGIVSCGTAAGAALGSAAIGTVFASLGSLSMLANGIFELVAGIVGFRRRNLTLAKVLAVVMLIIGIISIVTNLQDGSSVMGAVVSALLPILYYIGVQMAI